MKNIAPPLVWAGILASAYPAAAEEAAPSILILGSSHLAQSEDDYPDREFEKVQDALSAFEPDMLVVESLPADWAPGRGRDYRPDFDYNAIAEAWGMDRGDADRIAQRLERCPELSADQRCELAKAHFLRRDLANAMYYWLGASCTPPDDDLFEKYAENRSRHEMARLGFAVARRHDIRDVVSFDYQGDDAKWFIHELAGEVKASDDVAPEVAAQFELLEELGARVKSVRGDPETLLEMLRKSNSTRWIAFQYELYEWLIPSTIRYRRAGERQAENYWLRNRRMFETIEDAAAESDPERILVVVGAGHKYFLDELARDAGYDWVNPLDYLDSVAEREEDGPSR